MKLTFTDQFENTFSVDVPEAGITFPEIVEELIRPVFLAAGFQPETINEVFYPDKYPNDTEVITVDMEETLIDEIDQIARNAGLDRNDMMKAILGLELYRRGFNVPKP
jgi:hypothetical protein